MHANTSALEITFIKSIQKNEKWQTKCYYKAESSFLNGNTKKKHFLRRSNQRKFETIYLILFVFSRSHLMFLASQNFLMAENRRPKTDNDTNNNKKQQQQQSIWYESPDCYRLVHAAWSHRRPGREGHEATEPAEKLLACLFLLVLLLPRPAGLLLCHANKKTNYLSLLS